MSILFEKNDDESKVFFKKKLKKKIAGTKSSSF